MQSFSRLAILNVDDGNNTGVCFYQSFRFTAYQKMLSTETTSGAFFGMVMVLIFFLYLKMIFTVEILFLLTKTPKT